MILFIPIKHNSQRVPRKNFRKFGDQLLYERCFLKFKDFEIFIDTDSDELIDIIKGSCHFQKINVYKRKENLCGHKVSVCDLIKNFIIQENINEPVCQIHVTSPFLKPKTVKRVFQKLEEGYDSVIGCNVIQSRLWKKEKYGYYPINHNPLKLEQTQDLPEIYEDNSAFYLFQPNVILETGNRIGKNPYFFPVKFPENLDIDTEENWNFCLDILSLEEKKINDDDNLGWYQK